MPSILFVCCCGRCFLLGFYSNFGVNLCACLRSDEEETYHISVGKLYDSVVLYVPIDQNFLEEKFMPSFALFNKGYKVIKLPIEANFLTCQGHQACLKACKRIIVLVTNAFIQNEWNNQLIRNTIRKIARNDHDCKILLVNAEDIPYFKLDQYVNEVQFEACKEHHDLIESSKMSKWRRKLAEKLKYNCSLKEIEILDWQDRKFWTKFSYIMPMLKNPEKPTEIVQYSQKFAENICQSSSLMITNSFYTDYRKRDKFEMKTNPTESSSDPVRSKQLPLVTKFKSTPSSHRMCAKMFQQTEANESNDAGFVQTKDDFWTRFEKVYLFLFLKNITFVNKSNRSIRILCFLNYQQNFYFLIN